MGDHSQLGKNEKIQTLVGIMCMTSGLDLFYSHILSTVYCQKDIANFSALELNTSFKIGPCCASKCCGMEALFCCHVNIEALLGVNLDK